MSVRPSRRLSRTTVAAAAGAVAVTVLGGVAYAAIPSSANGVISGCYVTAGAAKGDLRVIDAQAGAVCPAGTTPISWNAKGIAFRGAYSPVTAYKVNDVVTSGGSSYIAKLNNTGVAVTNTTNWAVLAVKGANGAVGPRGLTGPQGPTGPQGASGPQGPAGPTSAGSFQKMPFFSTTTANTWQDVTSTSYFLPRGGNVLARVAAESFCSGTSWCSVRVLVDGNEMLGGSGSGAAFDDADASSTWEAHAIDRYAGGLSAGNHTFTVQAQAVGGSSPFFRLDDSTFVLQTLG